MSEVKLKAKLSCFIAKPSPKEISEGKPGPPLCSKPAPATFSPKDAMPVAKGTAADKKLVTIDLDSSDTEKDGKREAPRSGRDKRVPPRPKILRRRPPNLEVLPQRSVPLPRRTRLRSPARGLLALPKRTTLRFRIRRVNMTTELRFEI